MSENDKYYWVFNELYECLPAKIKEIRNESYLLESCINGQFIHTEVRIKDFKLQEVHPSCLKGVDDLLMLGDFDKQTMLHNTRERFNKDRIYSFIGTPILIAVNPYKRLDIYSDKHMKDFKKYFAKLKADPSYSEEPNPHLYHIAEAAYQDMIIDKKNQSIVISGESGSGKTESTKIILKFLAANSMAAGGSIDNSKPSVEKQVLDSNPLLEAFGNAKTVRNNNSSRFGKFIQVNFTECGKIISAKIYNYLLEKSRVVSVGESERSYHIFYQIIKGSNDQEKKKHHIRELTYYKILNRGCFDNEDQNDEEDFQITKECMKKLNFKPEETNLIFNVVMGILYLGNLEFEKLEDKPAVVASSTLSDLKCAAELIGADEDTIVSILTKKKMTEAMSKNVIEKTNKIEMVYNCRDALCKALYSKMFDYIVKRINAAIAVADDLPNAAASSGKEAKETGMKDNNKKGSIVIEKDRMKKIGILDIFGFENFVKNSFEQLCINYANERLQQFFNNHIFKLEQEEYKKEGIDFNQVEFIDNKAIIDLIDDGKNSIFNLLDSEALLPGSDNYSFRDKVYSFCKGSGCLGDDVEGYISINHFAGECFYDVDNFIEKNMDQLTSDIQEAMEKSKNKLVKKIFEKKEDDKKKKGVPAISGRLMADSLSKQFKKQLDDLIKMLNQSNPRFVKCIKPNPDKRPLSFDSIDVCAQLLSAGVLEAVKIRKQGYSIRRSQDEFVKRYQGLTPELFGLKESSSVGVNKFHNSNAGMSKEELEKFHIIKKALEANDYRPAITEMFLVFSKEKELSSFFSSIKKVQIGHTKVFMKEEVRNALEYKLNKIKYVNKIGATFKAFLTRRWVWRILKAARKLQAHTRGIISRRKFKVFKSCVIIQRLFKHYIMKKKIIFNLKRLAKESRKIKEEEERFKRQKKQLEEENKKQQTLMSQISNQNTSSSNIDEILTDRVPMSGSTSRATDMASANVKKKQKKPKAEDNIFNKLNVESSFSNYEKMYNDLLSKFVKTNEELSEIKKEKTNLEQIIESKDHEIEALKSKSKPTLNDQVISFNNKVNQMSEEMESNKQKLIQESSNRVLNDEAIEEREAEINALNLEIRKLKRENQQKTSDYGIIEMQVMNLQSKQKDLEITNEGLKKQIREKKDNFDSEFSGLYNQISSLEQEKLDLEIKYQNALKNQKSLSNLDVNKTGNVGGPESAAEIKKLQANIKTMKKNHEELKEKYEKDIYVLKSEITNKENGYNESLSTIANLQVELSASKERCKHIKEENDICNDQLEKLKSKFEEIHSKNKFEEFDIQINKIKQEMHDKIRKKDDRIAFLTEEKEELQIELDQKKRIEDSLKGTIIEKDRDINKLRDECSQLETEITKLDLDIMKMKKESQFTLMAKDKLEMQLKLNSVKLDNELQKSSELTRKVEILIDEQDKLRTKNAAQRKDIKKTQRLNQLMVGLLKLKKEELAIETVISTTRYVLGLKENSPDYMKAINEKEKIKQIETRLLKDLQQVSNNDYECSEEDEEEEEEDQSEAEDIEDNAEEEENDELENDGLSSEHDGDGFISARETEKEKSYFDSNKN